jgi:hypothetical protein
MLLLQLSHEFHRSSKKLKFVVFADTEDQRGKNHKECYDSILGIQIVFHSLFDWDSRWFLI